MKKIVISVIITLAFSVFAIQAVEQSLFSSGGIIESTNGGYRFPDGTMQTSAATPTGWVAIPDSPLKFVGYSTNLLSASSSIDLALLDGTALCHESFGVGSSISASREIRVAIDDGTFIQPASGIAFFLASDVIPLAYQLGVLLHDPHLNIVVPAQAVIAISSVEGLFYSAETLPSPDSWRVACSARVAPI